MVNHTTLLLIQYGSLSIGGIAYESSDGHELVCRPTWSARIQATKKVNVLKFIFFDNFYHLSLLEHSPTSQFSSQHPLYLTG